MNQLIETPFGPRDAANRFCLFRMVLCQKHLVENNHIHHLTRGPTEDDCFLCNDEWYQKLRNHLDRQAWLPEITVDDRVYISGPMSGYFDNNRPAFHLMEHVLNQTGCTVLSPARYQGDEANLSYAGFMRRDIIMMCQATKMVVLRGFGASKGAMLELSVAEVIKLPIFYEHIKD